MKSLSCLRRLTVSFVLGALAYAAHGREPEPLSAFPQSLLAIRTHGGSVVNFKVWLADTPQRDEQGLMFVKSMDEHAGMLFVFADARPVSMWMKNTYMPLDMLFINAAGRIDYVEVNATPLSLAVIGPPTVEHAVLELNGGAAERLGLHVGDTVIHRAFGNAH